MGMTDMQFKAYIRELIRDLERALKISPENEELKATIKSLKETLQS